MLAACALAGCSKSDRDAGTVLVTGKVTHNGQPLAGALVTFVSDAGGTPGAGMTDEDGGYSLRAKPGNYTAIVSKLTVPPPTKDASMEEALANSSAPTDERKETLPSKYQSFMESPFKIEVKASGTNAQDLSLSG